MTHDEESIVKKSSQKGSDGAADGVKAILATNRAVIDAIAGQLRTDSAARMAAADLLLSSNTAGQHLLLLAVARASSQGMDDEPASNSALLS